MRICLVWLFSAIALLIASGTASAVIIGENDLDNFGRTLCDINGSGDGQLGTDAPPVGQFYLVGGARDIFAGSGAIVSLPADASGAYRTDIVITSAHLFWKEGVVWKDAKQRFVYRIWERNGADCVQNDYEIADWIIGFEEPLAKKILGVNGRCDTKEYWTNFHEVAIAGKCDDPEYDWAVVRLVRPIPYYYPLIMPKDHIVQWAINGDEMVGGIGYAYHKSTDFGRKMSTTSCKLRPLPPESTVSPYKTLFASDCDHYSGMSGGPYTVTIRNDLDGGTPIIGTRPQQYLRYIVGVIKGALGENLDKEAVEESALDEMATFNVAVPIDSNIRSAFERITAVPPP